MESDEFAPWVEDQVRPAEWHTYKTKDLMKEMQNHLTNVSMDALRPFKPEIDKALAAAIKKVRAERQEAFNAAAQQQREEQEELDRKRQQQEEQLQQQQQQLEQQREELQQLERQRERAEFRAKRAAVQALLKDDAWMRRLVTRVIRQWVREFQTELIGSSVDRLDYRTNQETQRRMLNFFYQEAAKALSQAVNFPVSEESITDGKTYAGRNVWQYWMNIALIPGEEDSMTTADWLDYGGVLVQRTEEEQADYVRRERARLSGEEERMRREERDRQQEQERQRQERERQQQERERQQEQEEAAAARPMEESEDEEVIEERAAPPPRTKVEIGWGTAVDSLRGAAKAINKMGIQFFGTANSVMLNERQALAQKPDSRGGGPIGAFSDCAILQTDPLSGPFHATIWHCLKKKGSKSTELHFALHLEPGREGVSLLPSDASALANSPLYGVFTLTKPTSANVPKPGTGGEPGYTAWQDKDFKRTKDLPPRWVMPGIVFRADDFEGQTGEEFYAQQNWRWVARMYRTVEEANRRIKQANQGVTGHVEGYKVAAP